MAQFPFSACHTQISVSKLSSEQQIIKTSLCKIVPMSHDERRQPFVLFCGYSGFMQSSSWKAKTPYTNEVKWNHLKLSESKWNQVQTHESMWHQMKSNEINTSRMHSGWIVILWWQKNKNTKNKHKNVIGLKMMIHVVRAVKKRQKDLIKRFDQEIWSKDDKLYCFEIVRKKFTMLQGGKVTM